jgi:hypothetical protein
MHEGLQHRDACQVALECHRRRGLDVVAAGDNLGKLKGKKLARSLKQAHFSTSQCQV